MTARPLPPALGMVIATLATWHLGPMLVAALDARTTEHAAVRLFVGAVAFSLALQLATGLAIAFRPSATRACLGVWSLAVVALGTIGGVGLSRGSPADAAVNLGTLLPLVAPAILVWIAPLLTRTTSTASRRQELAAVLTSAGCLLLLQLGVGALQIARAIAGDRLPPGGVGFQLGMLAYVVVRCMLALRCARSLRGAPAHAALRAVGTYVRLTVAGHTVMAAMFVVTTWEYGPGPDFLWQQLLLYVSDLGAPLLLWRYARTELLADPAALPGLATPHEQAAPLAWGLLAMVPAMAASAVAIVSGTRTADVELPQAVVQLSGAVAALLAVVLAVASAATLRRRVAARRPALLALTLSIAAVVLYGYGAAQDPPGSMQYEAPFGRLTQLLAATATLWWMLRQRGNGRGVPAPSVR